MEQNQNYISWVKTHYYRENGRVCLRPADCPMMSLCIPINAFRMMGEMLTQQEANSGSDHKDGVFFFDDIQPCFTDRTNVKFEDIWKLS